MKLNTFSKVLLHILLWGIVLIVPLYVMSRDATPDYKPYMDFFMRITTLAILFYANYLYLVDKLLFNKQFVSYLFVNILLIAALMGVQSLVSEIFFLRPTPPQIIMQSMESAPFEMRGRPLRGKPPHFPMRIITDYLLTILIIGMSVAMKSTFRWYRDSINLEKIKSIQLEADLRNLRNQLNPHFLFNTLNNIYSLIALDATAAQEAVHRLSGLLRYVLFVNDQKFVSIDKELEFTHNFIDLMRLRIGSNVDLSVFIKDNGSDDPIASLMFITLIENAFKYGISTTKDSYIDIRIIIEKSKGLICTVENSLNESNLVKPIEKSGIGLKNLQRRLELLYPRKYEFFTEVRSESFFALLRIDF